VGSRGRAGRERPREVRAKGVLACSNGVLMLVGESTAVKTSNEERRGERTTKATGRAGAHNNARRAQHGEAHCGTECRVPFLSFSRA
jgi:hypothetical protein